MLYFTCPSITPSNAGSIHCTGSMKYEVHFSWPFPESHADSVILLWAKAVGPIPSVWDKMLELRNRARLSSRTWEKSKTNGFFNWANLQTIENKDMGLLTLKN